MSETETLVGKLIPEPIFENVEKTCERILFANGWGKEDYHGSFREALEDEGWRKYYITGDSIFKIEMISDDPYADIFYATKNEDGSYNFVLNYHNGGCGFNEAVEEALKNEREKQTI